MLRRLGLATTLALCVQLLGPPGPAHAGGPQDAYYANDADGVFWFMHLSDLHVGASQSIGEWYKQDPGNLIFALNDAVAVIEPVFVVATGDLVNGSRNNVPTSGQTQSQWDDYKAIYTAAQAAHPVPFYDIVGNHDEYATSSECPSLHWYLDNSYRGKLEGAAHFSWTHTTALGEYFFYGLNATGDCVPAYTGGDGTLLDDEFDAIKTALEANADASLRFVFAHQGPSQPVNSTRLVDELIKHRAFYLHGHIHEYKEYLASNSTGDIVVNEVNSTGKADTNNIGVGVVDHDAFIYRAASSIDPWPLVIVTAPVALRLRGQALNPWAYDACKDRENPVRALVFAPEPPTSVTVTIGGLEPVPMTQIDVHLWTAQVDTSTLAEGQQTVTVTAVAGGKTKSDAIGVALVAGPCAPQDDGGVPPEDGGLPVSPDGATGGDAAGEGDGGAADPDGGGGGGGGSGCDCSAARGGAGGSAALALVAIGLLAGVGRRRRGDR